MSAFRLSKCCVNETLQPPETLHLHNILSCAFRRRSAWQNEAGFELSTRVLRCWGRLLRNGLAAVESLAERHLVYHNLLAMDVEKWYNVFNYNIIVLLRKWRGVMKLGKLEEVDIRKVWPHEQYDFSKWLSSEENMQQLSETLNLSLTDIETEKFVGNYRCDILCKDEITGKVVLIENQLEPTNHDHLGKIITYASGLDASVVVWIVSAARDEHASAIEWLNKHTSDDLSFFLVEVHAYTIGDSAPAPLFKIIEQPNDFVKVVKSAAKNAEMNERQMNRFEFWKMLNDAIDNRGKPFNKHKATTDHWYTVAIGSSQCCISIDLVNKDHKIRVGLWIYDNKDLFDELHSHKKEIESSLGFELIWSRLDKRKASQICTYINGLDFNNQDNYPELIDKSIDLVLALRKAFKPFLK